MRALQKIVRNGNSTHVAIPRPLLIHLGWLPGESLIVELLEDDTLRLRRPQADDFLSVQRGAVRPVAVAKAAR
jgi:antitoxin component of MazEF toxin-antitoxin module